MKSFLFAALLIAPLLRVLAQDFSEIGAALSKKRVSEKELVPTGFIEVAEAKGDLNADGIPDMAKIIQSKSGSENDTSASESLGAGPLPQAVIIFLGEKSGKYRLWKVGDSHFTNYDPHAWTKDGVAGFDIDNGILTITSTLGTNFGAWSTGGCTQWWQNGKKGFRLLGLRIVENDRRCNCGYTLDVSYITGLMTHSYDHDTNWVLMEKKKILVPLILAVSAHSAELVNPAQVVGASIARPSLDSSAIRKIAERVKAEKAGGIDGLRFRIKDGIEANYSFGLGVDSFDVDGGKGVHVIDHGRVELWKFNRVGRVYIYKVGGSNMFSISGNPAVDNFLTSAYLFETGEIKYNDNQYFSPGNKSDGEFWKRNLISQGYGAQYIYRDNPFGRNGWLPIGFGYAMDALCGFLVVGGPILGQDMPAKVGMPLTGIGVSLFFKWLLNGMVAKGHMNTYNRFVNSGYPFPKHNGWNFDGRFEAYSNDSVSVKDVN